MAEAKTKSTTAEGEAEGTIEYQDMGDWTLEIDKRLPDEVRRRIPKSSRDVTLTDPVQHAQLEERIKVENEVAKQEKEDEETELEVPELSPPPDPNAEPESFTVTSEGASTPATTKDTTSKTSS